MTEVARLAATFVGRAQDAQDARATDEEVLRIVRVRETARAEIEVFLAVHEVSSFAPAKCAALVRAWGALAAMEALVWRDAIPSARALVPRVLTDTPDDFVARVLACAQIGPWADASAPSDRELDGHRRALLRAMDVLDRRVRRRVLARRLPWRGLRWAGLVVLVAALGAVFVGFALFRPRWRVSYYANDGLSGKPAVVSRALDPDYFWGRGGPGLALPNDHFSARFETCLVTERSATIVFTLGSDDGSRLFVDDRVAIDAWSDHNYAERTQSIALDAGTHALRLEYYERAGQARLTLAGRVESSGADVTGMLRAPKAEGPACAP